MKTEMKRAGRWAWREVAAVAAMSAGLLSSDPAAALSLGRLTVQSSLGEALRAEIDVTSLTPEEAANLRVRVAPVDSYRVAGIDYNPVLPATQVQLERRADGTAFLRIVSDRSVQEPFVDLILELSWATGRLLREYTLLFDPPSGRQPAQAAAPVTAPVAAAPAPAPAAVPINPPAPPADVAAAPAAPSAPRTLAEDRPRRPAPAVPKAPQAPIDAAPAEPRGGSGNVTVKQGDTLAKIAAGQLSQGVSLDQMLVSMFRGNAGAFLGNNMNRLRAGAVLTVPTAAQAAEVEPAEARKFIQAQSADFNAYRQRLAGAVPAAQDAAEASRRSTGAVKAEVQDRKQGGAQPADQLKLDRGKDAAAAQLDDKIAKERQQKEAAQRAAELARNVGELKKLQAASAPAAGAAVLAAASASAGLPMAVPPAAPVAPAVVLPVPAASAPAS
ncbi:MAG: hypothetical protein RL722_131, partial [Pseudomonadota bacterium]